ncbi:MAG: hypothetical protein ACRC6X_06210 [Culicoidibacterales bacterium]
MVNKNIFLVIVCVFTSLVLGMGTNYLYKVNIWDDNKVSQTYAQFDQNTYKGIKLTETEKKEYDSLLKEREDFFTNKDNEGLSLQNDKLKNFFAKVNLRITGENTLQLKYNEKKALVLAIIVPESAAVTEKEEAEGLKARILLQIDQKVDLAIIDEEIERLNQKITQIIAAKEASNLSEQRNLAVPARPQNPETEIIVEVPREEEPAPQEPIVVAPENSESSNPVETVPNAPMQEPDQVTPSNPG